MLRRPKHRSSYRATARGFTLVELMVVVLIITILAVIAIPGISRQLANREARKTADAIGLLYRKARLRAMARGSAVLVRYTKSTASYEVREAIQGTADACNQLPVSSCSTTDWTASSTTNQLLETLDVGTNADITVTMDTTTPLAADVASLDLCFTPLGRAFSGPTGAVGSLLAMTGAPRAQVDLAGGGLKRQVVIPPNGVARVRALP